MPAADLLGHCGPHSWLPQPSPLLSSGLQTLTGRIFPFLRQKALRKVRQAAFPNACWTSAFKLAQIGESLSLTFGLKTALTSLIPSQIAWCGKTCIISSCQAKCCKCETASYPTQTPWVTVLLQSYRILHAAQLCCVSADRLSWHFRCFAGPESVYLTFF